MTEPSFTLEPAPRTTEGTADGGLPDAALAPEAPALRQARRVARRLPAGVHCVAILRGRGCGTWCESAAVELAAALSETRTYTLLGNLEPGGGRLDAWLAEEEPGGLTDVVRGREVVASIAVPSWVHGFIYLPAGGRALPATALLDEPGFLDLARQVRRRGSVLLLYAPEGVGPEAFPARLLDGFVLFGERDGMSGRPGEIPLLGTVRPPRRAATGGGNGGPARTMLAAGRVGPGGRSAAIGTPTNAPAGAHGPGRSVRGRPDRPARRWREPLPSPRMAPPVPHVRPGRTGAETGLGRLLPRRRRPRSRSLAGAAGLLLVVVIAVLLSWLIATHDPVELLLDPWGERGGVEGVAAP